MALDTQFFAIYNKYDSGICTDIPSTTDGFYPEFPNKDELLHCKEFKFVF